MPRVYVPRSGSTKREVIDKDKLKRAVYDVLFNEKSIRGTAKAFKLSPMTLKRYVRKKREAINAGANSPKYEPDYRQCQIFNSQEELDFENYLDKASKLHHGLTPKAARELAYQFAFINEKKIPKNWSDNQIASYDWLHGFMRRHKNLSLRIPEATSLSRSTSFNRHNVSQFFQNLRSLYARFNFEPRDIWNVDETGITTVHRPKKIIASKGIKQVSKVTSGERGELVTVCAAINAAGTSIPPFMIFPRVNWQARMLDNAPPGTDGATFPSGWMTAVNFVKFLKHFKKNVRCSKENPCLIIFDNHDSHISIDSLNFAKDNGIHLLTIPPHTSQKLQPLDRIVFSALKSYYNTACDDWMLAHPGRPLTIYDLAECLGKAFPNATTPRNITQSFKVTGIYPYNSDIFTDDEFLSSYVTDRPEVPEEAATDVDDDGEILNRASPSLIVQSVDLSEDTQNVSMQEDEHDVDLLKDGAEISTAERASTSLIAQSGSLSGDVQSVGLQKSVYSSVDLHEDAPDSSSIKISMSCPTLVKLASLVLQKQIVPSKPRDATPSTRISKAQDITPSANVSFLQRDNTPLASISSKSRDITTLTINKSSTSKSTYTTLDNIKPFPKAGPRKLTNRGRKKGATKILTDTPEKMEIESELKQREEMKKQKLTEAVKKNFGKKNTLKRKKTYANKDKKKRKKSNANKDKKIKAKARKIQSVPETSSEEEDIEIQLSSGSDLCCSDLDDQLLSDEEIDDDKIEEVIKEGDWVVVNFVSERNMLHRYVAQITNESLASYDVKFAKKITDKRFKWPEKVDTSVIGKYQVKQKLPPPSFKSSSKRIGAFEFPKSLKNLKIDK